MNVLTFVAVATFLLLLLFVFLFLMEKQRHHATHLLLKQEKERYSEELGRLGKEKDTFLQEKILLGNQLSEKKVLLENLQEDLKTQLEQQKQLVADNRFQFEQLSNKLLDEKATKFALQNQQSLDQLLKPLQEKIKDFEKKVADTYQRESNERFSLQQELKRTFELNQLLSKQADNLVQALKSDSKKQGNWGEFLLEKILESAGLQENIHYQKQISLPDESGQQFRPDVVLNLPENKHIVIDAKVSLTAYERYFNTDNQTEKQQALQAHIRSIKNHVDELWNKKYERLLERSPDFVLMFVPVEPAYSLALIHDPSLYEKAYRKKVILVSVSSLMATLRIIESIWRLEKQNKNAFEIINEGNKLYDKLAGFVTDMSTLGDKLNSAQKTYDLAMVKLSTGRGNLVRHAEKMKELGLNPAKRLNVRKDG